MLSDIQFDGEQVKIEGSVLAVHAADLIIDSPDRRTKTKAGKKTPPYRRALVHDQQDGLTINFNGDYPGGVTAYGTMRVDAFRARRGNALICQSPDFILDAKERRSSASDPKAARRALVHDQADGLTINFNDDYPGGVTLNGVVRFPGRIEVVRELPVGHDAEGVLIVDSVAIDLWETLDTLTSEVAFLRERVAALEGR